MNGSYDIIIIGAGLVGASLAAALKKSGFRIAVLETHVPVAASAGADSRPLSLAYGSQKILNTLEIWQHLSALAEPIHTVHVSEQNHFGILRFRAAEENVPALGYVLPFDELQNCLYQQAAQNPGVKFVSMQKLLRVENASGKVIVTIQTIDGEKTLEAELLVAADGAHSPTRELLGIPAREKTSQEVALTLLFETVQPHQHTAYERFTSQGIIAVLPLKNPHHCRLVWTLDREYAEQVSTWSDAQLADYLRAALHGRLGEWQLLQRGKTYPLETLVAQEQIRPGVVLLGNAAHTLYPLAAQGFNLGLRDAATLAEILVDARANNQTLNDDSVLKSYVAWRGADQRWILGFTDHISQVFGVHIPGVAALRAAGLLVTDLIPPLKHRLAKRLLGLAGKCPKLARGIPL